MSEIDLIQHDLPSTYYLVDVGALRARCRSLKEGFERHFDDVAIAYSYKTNYFPSVIRTMNTCGVWAEVVSSLEYDLARRIGVPSERIIFNGPIKSDDALLGALSGNSRLHLDSVEEAERLTVLAQEAGVRDGSIGLRINVAHPEGEGHRARSRFGIPIESVEAVTRRLREVGLDVRGVHAHLATKERSLEHFEGLVAQLGEAIKLIGADEIEWIDVGGGFGFTPPDLDGRSYPSFEEYAGGIRAALDAIDPCLASRQLVIEPGMVMVNDAVRFLTRVETTKTVGDRRLAFLDASIQTVKPTRHGMNLPTRVFDSNGREKIGNEEAWDLVGYTCMDDDFIAIDDRVPALEAGDRIEFKHVGAYTAVFKPRFIRSMPAVWAIDGSRLYEDAHEESFDEFLQSFDLGDPA